MGGYNSPGGGGGELGDQDIERKATEASNAPEALHGKNNDEEHAPVLQKQSTMDREYNVDDEEKRVVQDEETIPQQLGATNDDRGSKRGTHPDDA